MVIMLGLDLLLVALVPFGPQAPDTAAVPAAPGHPPATMPRVEGRPALFETSDRCMACHNGLTTPAGEDMSIGFEWRASMMANSARDPYWQAAVRREVMDHPEAQGFIEDKCSTCHMPMARYEAHLAGEQGQVFENLPVGTGGPRRTALAADGVSCATCHQITAEGLGDASSFTGGFRVDEAAAWGERTIFGPFETDSGRAHLMNSATGFTPREAGHMQSSELCATCHTLYTESLDDQGNQVGELPEQVPYLEWRHSSYARSDSAMSCQTCHMPVVEDPVPVTSVLGQDREQVSRHVFRGGNFFMLGMLNRYRNELGTEALPQEMDAAVRRTLDHLQSDAASLALDAETRDDELVAEVTVVNLAGHKLPTAYPSRRAWLQFTVRDAAGEVVFESGGLDPSGAIRGNDNDEDPAAFEPHYREITRPDQVQIYEPILLDFRDEVTTGLLFGVRYGKDNRILPAGFDKETAEPDVAVQGGARDDPDFVGGSDRVRYRVPVSGVRPPLAVEVALWYQPIGFRWARNLE
ncbi:MAG: hypothetical protein ACOCUZ_01105, partial [bacterium]